MPVSIKNILSDNIILDVTTEGKIANFVQTDEPIPTLGHQTTEGPETTAKDIDIPREVTDAPKPDMPNNLVPYTTEPPFVPVREVKTTAVFFITSDKQVVYFYS